MTCRLCQRWPTSKARSREITMSRERSPKPRFVHTPVPRPLRARNPSLKSFWFQGFFDAGIAERLGISRVLSFL